jgi:hypothetical protein
VFTVLHWACRNRSFCQKAIIKVQFSDGANLSKLVFGELTSFHLASYHNQTSPLIFWTRYGSDYRETPAFPADHEPINYQSKKLISHVHFAIALCNDPLIRVSPRRRTSLGNDIAQMNACIAFTDHVFEMVNILSAVCVADLDHVVAGEHSVFDGDEFRGGDRGEEEDGGWEPHFGRREACEGSRGVQSTCIE